MTGAPPSSPTYSVGRRGWVGELGLAELVQLVPGFAGIALWLRHVERLDHPGVAATDGVNCFYYADFAGLPVRCQASVIFHEVLHAALQHPARGVAMARIKGPRYNHQLMNWCMDALINEAILSKPWVQLPGNPVRLSSVMDLVRNARQEAGLPTPENDLCDRPAQEWSIETLYEFVDQTALAAGRALSAPGGFAPDVEQTETAQPEQGGIGGDPALGGAAEGMDENAVFERMQGWSRRLRGLASGRDTAGIIRGLQGDIPKVRTPWEPMFRRLLSTAIQPVHEATWLRPSRRGILEPGYRRSKPVPRVVVAVDSSGSINQEILVRFAGEILNLNRRTGAEIIIVVCDAAVTEVVKPRSFDVLDTLKRVRFRGGGGTSFVPALAEAEAHRPDAVVYLTDLYGAFPEQKPRFPVFWAVPELANPNPNPPFGTTIKLY
mgnify:CR=1 FL=1